MSTPNSSASSSPTDNNLPERKDKGMWENEKSKDDDDTTCIPSLGSGGKKLIPLFWDAIPPRPVGPRVYGRTSLRPKVIPKGYHFDVFEGVHPMLCWRCGMWFDHMYDNCPKDKDSPEVVKWLENFPTTQRTPTKVCEEEKLPIEQSPKNGLKNKEEETHMKLTLAEEELTTDQSLEYGLQGTQVDAALEVSGPMRPANAIHASATDDDLFDSAMSGPIPMDSASATSPFRSPRKRGRNGEPAINEASASLPPQN